MDREADGLAEPDGALASRAANGDNHAFDQLMTRYQAMLFSACLKITGNPDDARDALQDALLRAWWGLPGFRGESKVSTWLYRIAANAALAEVQRRVARAQPSADWDADRRPQAVSETDRVADRMSLDAALRRLPPHYRAAIVLRELCDCSYEEIGDILQIPVNTVKSRISRARQALLDLLAGAEREGVA